MSNIITTNDFSLPLGGLESFYSAQPATTSRATAVVAFLENTYTQLPTEHQSDDQQLLQQQQQQQKSSPHLQQHVLDSQKPEDCPQTTFPAAADPAATIETESSPPATHDQQAFLGTHNHVTLSRSSERDLSRSESALSTQYYGAVVQPIPGAPTSPALTTAPATSTKVTTKSIQSPQLCTNATEFITNYIWHIPAPTSHRTKEGQPVAPMHLPEPSAATSHTIRDRSVDFFPTQNPPIGFKQSSKLSTVPKQDKALNGGNRHQRCFKSDSYASVNLLPGPDDGRSTQVALERLRSLQYEPHEAALTGEKKGVMTEYGRAIGNGGPWPSHHHSKNNSSNCSNYNHRNRQNYDNNTLDMLLRGKEGGVHGFKITYGRDFLMSFSGLKAPPDSIDSIHWIQLNSTLDNPQKAVEPRMARSQPVFQEPGGEYQGTGTYGPEVSHRHSRCDDSFRGESAVRGDIGFGGEINLSGNDGLERDRPSKGKGAFRGDYGFRGGGGQRGHGTSTGENGFRGEGGIGAPTFHPPFPPALRRHVRRSSASATGRLSGSVYSFKTREPLGPPAAPRSDLQMKGFETHTAL
ncbi:hypothetical protein BG015_003627 [Linnemannia schmuckeri]|uniref:Uncharacterized protein n=1 Tax=Linnemannia schmuckeri TaxID=64567 RepID=A0A9P5VD66_9FUNG|nr:hypothetical protein BG015_003627 [Linnemannia schmuckeri]